MVTRCKFVCLTVKQDFNRESKSTWEYEFQVVYANSIENKKYWDYTPAGNLKLSTMNQQIFKAGKEYYLDIVPVLVEETSNA